MKERILELRKAGFSYRAIENELGCSKGTVAFHCGKGQKEKYAGRRRTLRYNNPLSTKIDTFSYRKPNDTRVIRDGKRANLRDKCRDFQRRTRRGLKARGTRDFDANDVLYKYSNETSCYLTGRPIKLDKPTTYSLDHIVPASRGGDNSFSNMGIACREANKAKTDLTKIEFIELCKDVLLHNGYTIIEPLGDR